MASLGYNKDVARYHSNFIDKNPKIKSGLFRRAENLVEKYTFEIYESKINREILNNFEYELVDKIGNIWWISNFKKDEIKKWITFNPLLEETGWTWSFKTKLKNQIFILIEKDGSISYFIK